MNDFGFDLSPYVNDLPYCAGLLAGYLNEGHLGLILGSGASKALSLPLWYELMEKCRIEMLPAASVITKDTPSHELKEIASKIKKECGTNVAYLELVHRKLYEGVSYDFVLAKKELLIALTSLFVGKKRGNVKQVVTYNFDSVLEWYLNINGLGVDITPKNHLDIGSLDVEILHIHGYLPFEPSQGQFSDEIIFSKEEFVDRQIGRSYWKDLMNDFYRRNVFLTVGLSEESLVDDVIPYLRSGLSPWYDTERITRGHPYGVAFLTSCSDDNRDIIIDNGIIPCVFSDVLEIPLEIFNISQNALAK